MSNDTPGRQGGDRDERDDAPTPDPGGLSWDELLTGRTPAAGTPVAATPPPSVPPAATDDEPVDPLAFITGQIPVQQAQAPGQPLTRRQAREAADAAAAAAPVLGTGTDPVIVQPSGSRAQRRSSARSDGYPEREKRGRAGAIGCLVIVLVFVGIAVGGWFALQGPIQQFIASTQGPADYKGSGTGDVTFAIVDGDIGADVARNLHEQGVTASFDAFYDLLLAQNPAPVFQPGAYALHEKMSAKAALAALEDPANRLENTVVVPEGTAAADVYQIIADATKIPVADVQAAAADVPSFGLPAEATTLEGFLFPATYTFDPGVTAQAALKTMVDRSFQALDEAGVAPEQRWDTIRLASLVQKEAGLRDDYYKVSRVFLNRLEQGWKLQSDATVAYGTGNTHVVTTTDAERADANNLYNTYVHDGLPIGPISNPGDLAIDAALHPADGPWMFFVTWNLDTGETIFSETAEEHDAAVEKWLAWMDEHPEYGG
ncbi:MAG: endolytic transglycosylase MltG [Leifsonia sp.]